MGAFHRFKSWMQRLFTSTDNSIAVFYGTTGDKLRSTGITIDDNDLFAHPAEGNQFLLSQDASPFKTGSWSVTTSGELYTLVGDLVMFYQSHNVNIDSNGDFAARDEDGDHCQLFVWTESGEQIYYVTSNTTGVPVWNKVWEFDLVNGFLSSGDNTFNFQSQATDGASAVAFLANAGNEFTTNGAKIFSVQNNSSPVFEVRRENGNMGVWADRFAAGTASVDAYSFFKLAGTLTGDFSMPDGTGAFDLDATINMTAAIKQAAAFTGKATITGSAVLPFISGMLFQVDQQGTGGWGANPGNWGQSPTVIAGRFTSQAGSANLGNWGNTFFSGTPVFAGGDFSGGTFNHFEAGRIVSASASQFNNANGIYIRVQNATTNAYGIYIEPGITGGTDSAGIVLHDDGDAGSILFGAGKDARVYYDGSKLNINPKEAGAGYLDILGRVNADQVTIDAGTTTVAPIKFTSGTLLTTPEAGAMEYDGGHWYITNGARHAISSSSGVKTSNTTVANTVTETEIYSYTFAAAELHLDEIITATLNGVYSAASGTDVFTLRFKIGGTTVHTIARTAKGALTNEGWESTYRMTIRTDGASGTFVDFAKLIDNDSVTCVGETTTHSIDTTTSTTLQVTAQWNAASASNSITCSQADITFKH